MSEEVLHRSIVPAIALARHAARDLLVNEAFLKLLACVLTALIRIHDGEPVKLLRSIYPQIYKWYKKYALIASGDSFVIVAHPHMTKMLTWRQ